jgi:hypothetical protein
VFCRFFYYFALWNSCPNLVGVFQLHPVYGPSCYWCNVFIIRIPYLLPPSFGKFVVAHYCVRFFAHCAKNAGTNFSCTRVLLKTHATYLTFIIFAHSRLSCYNECPFEKMKVTCMSIKKYLLNLRLIYFALIYMVSIYSSVRTVCVWHINNICLIKCTNLKIKLTRMYNKDNLHLWILIRSSSVIRIMFNQVVGKYFHHSFII